MNLSQKKTFFFPKNLNNIFDFNYIFYFHAFHNKKLSSLIEKNTYFLV